MELVVKILLHFLLLTLVNAVRGPPRAEKNEIKHVAKVGDSLKIKCPIHGYPQPIVSWAKDEADISYAWSRYRTTRKTLKIKRVSKEDMGVYVCTGINGFGKAETRIELVVINPEDFPSISETDISKLAEPMFTEETVRATKDITVNVGENVSLLCVAEGHPAPRLSWYKNNELYRDSGTSLMMKEVTTTDSGVYTCVAQNMVGSTSVKYRLNVMDGEGKVEEGTDLTNKITVNQGGTALIDCNVHTEDRPSVKWLKKLDYLDFDTVGTVNNKDSHIISVGDEHYKIIGDDENLTEVSPNQWLSQLIVRTARIQDRGMYICFVTSGGRGFNFKQSYLSVLEDFAKEVEQEFPIMAIVIVLALVLVITIIVTAVLCRVCRQNKISETTSDTSDGAGVGVHQQLLKPSQSQTSTRQPEKPGCVQSSTPKVETWIPHKMMDTRPRTHATTNDCLTDNNLSSVVPGVPALYHQMTRDRQFTYFVRDQQHQA